MSVVLTQIRGAGSGEELRGLLSRNKMTREETLHVQSQRQPTGELSSSWNVGFENHSRWQQEWSAGFERSRTEQHRVKFWVVLQSENRFA